MLLLLAAFCVKGQTVICKDTLIEIRDTSIIYERDTSLIITSVLDHYDTTYIVKCGRWCRVGVTPVRIKIDKITAVYRADTSYIYDSTPITLINISTIKDTVCYVEPVKTSWGIKIQKAKFADQLNVAQQLGVTSIRPNAIGVKTYNGELNNVVDWKQAGLKTVININWIEDNTQKPFDFVHGADTALYKINFERICKDIVPYADVLIIENEPTNGDYYNWNLDYYAWELRTAIAIAHKYGLKVADGCTHIELIELVRTNQEYLNPNAPEVHQLLDLYKTLDLDFIDLHTSYNKDSRFNNGYPVPDMKVTVDWARNYTGHQAIVNEWVIKGGTADVERKMVSDFRSCNMPFVVGWSGDGGENSGDAYNIGLILTAIGIAYRDVIK